MSLSPLHEILVLLEDEKKVPLFRINRWGKSARGVLAKLKSYGWVNKIKFEGEDYYEIASKGEQAMDRFLRPLKLSGKWDGKWRLVMFDIPETDRDVRDKLRRYLSKMGLGILQASVWISPNDIQEEILEIGQRLDLGSKIKIFEVSRNNNLDETIINKSWNMPDLDNLYIQYNNEVLRVLKSIDKDPAAKYTAKKYIFEYALILQKDPILPIEFRNKNHLRKASQEYYLKLKNYII